MMLRFVLELWGVIDVLDELVIAQAVHLPGHPLLKLTIRMTKMGNTNWAVVLLGSGLSLHQVVVPIELPPPDLQLF
jgi:hypothetical protein